MRAEVTVIHAIIHGQMAVHFTDTKLQGDDIWFPTEEGDLFGQIEWLMVAHGVAHNCCFIEKLREGETYVDYRVTYNLPE